MPQWPTRHTACRAFTEPGKINVNNYDVETNKIIIFLRIRKPLT